MTSQIPGAPAASQPQRIDPGVLLTDLARGVRTTLAGATESTGQVALGHATTAPGPAGVLVAPMSGQPCVWFRAMVYPSARWLPLSFSNDRRTLPAIAPSNIPYAGTFSDLSSTTPFAVTDGLAAVEVWPARTDVDTHVQSVNQLMPNGEVHVEWVVPPDAPVLVIGAVGRPDGETPVLQHPAGPPVVTTKDEKWLGDRARAQNGLDPTYNAIRARSGRIALVVGLAVFAACLLPVLLILLT